MPLTSQGDKTSLAIDVFPQNSFWVEIEGMLDAYFTECSGLTVNTEVMTVREGGLNNHVHQLPVRTSFNNLVLKTGYTMSNKLWEWYQKTINGKIEFKNISILLYLDSKPGVAVKRWEIEAAYPIKWNGPQFNSSTNELMVESIEVAFRSFYLTK